MSHSQFSINLFTTIKISAYNIHYNLTTWLTIKIFFQVFTFGIEYLRSLWKILGLMKIYLILLIRKFRFGTVDIHCGV